jgi:hypothetical protein
MAYLPFLGWNCIIALVSTSAADSAPFSLPQTGSYNLDGSGSECATPSHLAFTPTADAGAVNNPLAGASSSEASTPRAPEADGQLHQPSRLSSLQPPSPAALGCAAPVAAAVEAAVAAAASTDGQKEHARVTFSLNGGGSEAGAGEPRPGSGSGRSASGFWMSNTAFRIRWGAEGGERWGGERGGTGCARSVLGCAPTAQLRCTTARPAATSLRSSGSVALICPCPASAAIHAWSWAPRRATTTPAPQENWTAVWLPWQAVGWPLSLWQGLGSWRLTPLPLLVMAPPPPKQGPAAVGREASRRCTCWAETGQAAAARPLAAAQAAGRRRPRATLSAGPPAVPATRLLGCCQLSSWRGRPWTGPFLQTR